MKPTEIRPGLYRWTAGHPDWLPGAEPGEPADWPEQVGCIAYETPDALVTIDALVPVGDEAAFWSWLDRLADRCGGRVLALTTISFHRRSRDELVDRYGASTSRARANLPPEVVPIPLRGAGETMFWLPQHAALVPGDRILGDESGGLRMCPASWLDVGGVGPIGPEELRNLLLPLLELPIEIVLVSHWEPVLAGGRAELERALAPAA